MVQNVTHEMLRQKILATNQAVKQSAITNVATGVATTESEMTIEEKKITAVKTDNMICSDGTIAKILQPYPNMTFSAIGTPSNDGAVQLRTPFNAMVVKSGDTSYVMGLNHAVTDEFELKFKMDKNEIRINKDFISINANTLIVNGVEKK